MARPLQIEFPGAAYHITSRGYARQAILIDDEHRGQFFYVLSMLVERFDWLYPSQQTARGIGYQHASAGALRSQ
jgi:hypothetical protein